MENQNLKLALMTLGNRLVTEKGYLPANQFVSQRVLVGTGLHNTSMIAAFTEWLNRSPEAQQILTDMGIAWPVVERPSHADSQ